MKFDILRARKVERPNEQTEDGGFLSPTALSTVGLRRATETRSIKVHNRTGLDVHVYPDATGFDPDSGLVSNNTTKSLHNISGLESESVSLTLRLSQSAIGCVGEREPVYDLPLASSHSTSRIFLLRPVATYEFGASESYLSSIIEGRASPETILSGATHTDFTHQNAEPVVEWCMECQRLRSTTVDVFSIDKGRDLLSSYTWSPDDAMYEDVEVTRELMKSLSEDGLEPASNQSPRRPKRLQSSTRQKSNWSRPYLKNDSPEWTDLTCTLRMARDRVILPDMNWLWVNDWSVELGELGESTDADGWEYEADFETFTRTRRDYLKGDSCRRRRWTRTRIVKPPRLDDPLRLLKFVWESSMDDDGNYDVVVRSHLRVTNATGIPLTFFVYSPSWDDDVSIGTAKPTEEISVPIHLASAVYMRLAKPAGSNYSANVRDYVSSERFVILPMSHTSLNYIRTSMTLEDVSSTTLHYLIEIKSDHGVVDITVQPVVRVINLLPCQLECQLGEVLEAWDTRTADGRPILGNTGQKRIAQCETITIASGKDGVSTALSPWGKPHISLRVPGTRWSAWQRIVNRRASSDSWRPSEKEEDWYFKSDDFPEETTTIIRFNSLGNNGDPLNVIMSVECGHCPTLRVYAQYWIVDKSGFGCRFSQGFADLLGTTPDWDTSRRSYLDFDEGRDQSLKRDMALQGHQWSIGMQGMSMFFSPREKITLSIEAFGNEGNGNQRSRRSRVRSKWASPMDVSNVVPKTVFSVDEMNGARRFELAISVTMCPGLFSRTKLITLLPRYQIVNLLHRELVVAQDGCQGAETLIPSQSVVPFHWEKGNLPPKVRLGAPSSSEKGKGVYDRCWSNGRFRVDRVGITAMRLPTNGRLPLVVQAEVRLASKDQSSAVVIVIWAANPNSNPLYILRNRTPYSIICRQPLHRDEQDQSDSLGEGRFSLPGCSGVGDESPLSCNTDAIGPMIKSMLGLDRTEEFIWALKSNDIACFGFDDPERPHVLEWACATRGSLDFKVKRNVANVEVDAMGSTSILEIPGRRRVRCEIRAEHSTKVIEFSEIGSNARSSPDIFSKRGLISDEKTSSMNEVAEALEYVEEDEDPAFTIRLEIPGLYVSIVDNVNPACFGREILYAQLEKVFFSFSQTREGYHEFELRLLTLQVDNHVNKSIHPVLVFCPQFGETEPLLHMSAVRRLQEHSNTYVFRYAAIRLLEVQIYLDRRYVLAMNPVWRLSFRIHSNTFHRTAECIALFIDPLISIKEDESDKDHPDWLSLLTNSMAHQSGATERRSPTGEFESIRKQIHNANSGRIYVENLHLHPVRIILTFSQDQLDWNAGESTMLFQFIRGMVRNKDVE